MYTTTAMFAKMLAIIQASSNTATIAKSGIAVMILIPPTTGTMMKLVFVITVLEKTIFGVMTAVSITMTEQ